MMGPVYAQQDIESLLILGIVTLLAVTIGSVGYALCQSAAREMPAPDVTTPLGKKLEQNALAALARVETDRVFDFEAAVLDDIAHIDDPWEVGADPWLRPSAATAVCDTRHEHEIRIVTDGRTAYARGPVTDCPTAHVAGGLLRVTCGQPDADDEPCTGEVVVDLAWETRTADDVEAGWLSEYGAPVEHGNGAA